MQRELIAGDSLDFETTVPGYLASDGWTLTYRLVPRSGSAAVIEFNASASGDDYAIAVAAGATAQWAAGEYSWAAYVSKSGARHTVEDGTITIRPDPGAIPAGTDTRSHAQIVLDAIEAVIERRATKDQEEYRIGDRMLKHTPLAELRAMREEYRREVAAETRKRLGIRSRDVFVRFGRA